MHFFNKISTKNSQKRFICKYYKIGVQKNIFLKVFCAYFVKKCMKIRNIKKFYIKKSKNSSDFPRIFAETRQKYLDVHLIFTDWKEKKFFYISRAKKAYFRP